MTPRILGLLLLATLGACRESPLYDTKVVGGTLGEVPRDGNGEPMLGAVRPARLSLVTPPPPLPAPLPPSPR